VNILVPPDIVPVKRVSPIRAKKRTIWRDRPQGEPIDRGREWMCDNLFVASSRDPWFRGLVTGSFAVHFIAGVAVVVVLVSQAHRVSPLVKVTAPMVMPVMVSVVPVPNTPIPRPAPKVIAKAAPKPVQQPPAATPSPAAAPPPVAAREEAAPIEAPSTVAPDTTSSDSPHGAADGVDGGVAGGIAGGVVGGVVGGDVAGGGPREAPPSGPIRLRAGIDPPRKIKDVKPAYPMIALASFKRGTVIIEATVGVDGKVLAATILRSVRFLDEAALTAVRQWEYLPARMNGVPVTVIMTVLVEFSIAN
jgi:protein TonB